MTKEYAIFPLLSLQHRVHEKMSSVDLNLYTLFSCEWGAKISRKVHRNDHLGKIGFAFIRVAPLNSCNQVTANLS